MKSFFHFIILILISIAVTSCAESKGTTLSGQITDAPNLSIFLDKLEIRANQVIEKTDADASGKFKFNFPEGLDKGMYRIRVGAKAAHLLIEPKTKKIEITGSIEDLKNDSYQITGSEATQQFVALMSKFRKKEISREQLEKNITTLDPYLGLLINIRAFPMQAQFAEQHLSVANKLQEVYPDDEITQDYFKLSNALNVQYKRMLATQKIKPGQPAPDISLGNPDGKEIKLSDLKGKVVLLDFWASWCGPCRRDNPKVVRTYDKYKDQGFTVFSVSLDGLDQATEQRYKSKEEVEIKRQQSKERWLAAIKKDNLKWESHVSDLKKWDSEAAATYGVRSIPQTFLIDRDGTIAAVNPRYNLEKELLKVL